MFPDGHWQVPLIHERPILSKHISPEQEPPLETLFTLIKFSIANSML